jgi:hypothetical protein
VVFEKKGDIVEKFQADLPVDSQNSSIDENPFAPAE